MCSILGCVHSSFWLSTDKVTALKVQHVCGAVQYSLPQPKVKEQKVGARLRVSQLEVLVLVHGIIVYQ